jgi:hypothetical protein
MKLLLSLFLITNLCFAQEVKVVKKGEAVPFDGVLFTKELEKDIRGDIDKLKRRNEILVKINEVTEKEVDVLTKRLSLYQSKSKELADREVKSERDVFIKNALYFLSGALITGFISYGVTQANR